jgi:hypothetical protein
LQTTPGGRATPAQDPSNNGPQFVVVSDTRALPMGQAHAPPSQTSGKQCGPASRNPWQPASTGGGPHAVASQVAESRPTSVWPAAHVQPPPVHVSATHCPLAVSQVESGPTEQTSLF